MGCDQVIPNFLHSIAAQVRALVASGKALHVTSETADELELVAGLFKKDVPLVVVSEVVTRDGNATRRDGVARPIAPADIALAWLKLSRAQPSEDWVDGEHDVIRVERVQEKDAKRAAECAELATIASRIDEPNGQSIELDGEELRLCSPINPHEGTRDGARAAWMHIANHLQPDLRPVIKAQYGCVGVRDANQGRTEIGNRYRRELETL